MERHASALKAARQAIKHQARNRATLSKCRSVVKDLTDAIANTKDKAELKKQVGPLLAQVQKTLMKAASKNILKKQTVSRKIARLSKSAHVAISA